MHYVTSTFFFGGLMLLPDKMEQKPEHHLYITWGFTVHHLSFQSYYPHGCFEVNQHF